MDKSKLKIASVKLVNNGMKGIEVEYLLPSVKLNVMFNDVYKVKRKAPIHSELEEQFSSLRNHLLDVCGYTLQQDERSYLLSCLEVTGAKYGSKGIILIGELAILGGEKSLYIETPLITDETEYQAFGELANIIDNIYAETKEYMEGRKVMSDTQIVARFNAKNEDFDIEYFNKLSKEEQRDWATKIMEDQGHMVLLNDEISNEPAGIVIDATEQFKQPLIAPTLEQEYSFSDVNTPENTVAATTTVKLPVSKEFITESKDVVTLTEDDDFILPGKKEEKKSTAKKKVA